MAPRLRRTAALLLICAACKAPGAAGAQPNSNEKLLDPIRVDATSFGTLRNGSVGAGCALCRDSGNCSVAASDAASGVFCGDLHTSATVQPCCCPYYTECRVTNESVACECGGAWPFASELELQQRERLTAADPANNTETHDSDVLETDGVNDDMALSTEILIHLSAYLGLFVFAVYVDQWVDCFSDCRRNQMVAYGPGTNKRTLRFRRRFGKRRRGSDAGEDLEADDKRPLLVVTPSSTPLIASPSTSDSNAAAFVVTQEQQIVVVTIPADAVQEVGDRHVNHQEQHAAATS
ncbi:hypothetical protein BBJ28_00001367 [Nothophytophthora sp. Chile5]|nr:hypothetical protein BBJ28_00001367 [Nothophytophthora sp. Chile5]